MVLTTPKRVNKQIGLSSSTTFLGNSYIESPRDFLVKYENSIKCINLTIVSFLDEKNCGAWIPFSILFFFVKCVIRLYCQEFNHA